MYWIGRADQKRRRGTLPTDGHYHTLGLDHALPPTEVGGRLLCTPIPLPGTWEGSPLRLCRFEAASSQPAIPSPRGRQRRDGPRPSLFPSCRYAHPSSRGPTTAPTRRQQQLLIGPPICHSCIFSGCIRCPLQGNWSPKCSAVLRTV